MIDSVEVRHQRIVRDVQMSMERLTVLVGPNGAGKSTLMGSIAGMLALADKRIQGRSNGPSAPAQTLEPDCAGRLTFSASDGNGDCYEVNIGGVVRPGSKDRVEWVLHRRKGQNRSWKGGEDGKAPADFSQAPQYALYVRLDPNRVKQPADKAADLNKFDVIGESMAAYVANLKLEDDDQYEFLKESLCAVVPSVSGLLVDSKSSAKHYMLEVLLDGGLKVPARHLSDGTAATIGLITALSWTGGRPGVVLIDDIDQGLHPKAQVELIVQLRRLMHRYEDMQVVASTHSPYLLDAFQPDEVRCVYADAERGTRVAKLSDHEDFDRWKDEMSPGEFWSAVGEEWVVDR